MREVLLVTKNGDVHSGVPEDKIRHDIVAAAILKNRIDANYQEPPTAIAMYDNCLNAAKFYQILAILDDDNDLVAFFPDVISPEQIIYFIENFAEEAEEKKNSKITKEMVEELINIAINNSDFTDNSFIKGYLK